MKDRSWGLVAVRKITSGKGLENVAGVQYWLPYIKDELSRMPVAFSRSLIPFADIFLGWIFFSYFTDEPSEAQGT